MRVAIASGKGGTGKTTAAVSLALTLAQEGQAVELVDCDVEQPDAHLFLDVTFTDTHVVETPIPVVDPERCSHCGSCAAACQFGALACVKDQVFVFEELCHGCGACLLACPEGAISEKGRRVGVVREGDAGPLHLIEGRLDVGQAMPVPVIRATLAATGRRAITIIDAPPGASCPVIGAVRGADLVLLVAEPTPFGLHDLRQAAGVVKALDVPTAAVINRAGSGDGGVHAYLRSIGVPILLEIPDDRRIAEGYADGRPLVEALPEYRPKFVKLWEGLRELIQTRQRKAS